MIVSRKSHPAIYSAIFLLSIFISLALMGCELIENKQQLQEYKNLELKMRSLGSGAENYDKRLKIIAGLTPSWNSPGYSDYIKRKYHKLITSTYADLIKAEPENPRAYYERAFFNVGPEMTGLSMKAPKRNLEDIDRAVSLEPNNPDYQERRSQLQYMNMNAREAAKALDLSIKLRAEKGDTKGLEGSSLNDMRFMLAKIYSFSVLDDKNAVRVLEDALKSGIQPDEYTDFLDLYVKYYSTKNKSIDHIYNELLKNESFKKQAEQMMKNMDSPAAQDFHKRDAETMRLFNKRGRQA